MKNIDKFFMDIADKVAEQSTCISRQVGSVLVKDNRIISIGYNGTPSGVKHCNEIFTHRCEEHNQFSEIQEVHSEMNAILYALKNGINLDNTTLYITISPCKHCCKLILTSGIKKIVCKDYYIETDGLKFLVENGVKFSLLNKQ